MTVPTGTRRTAVFADLRIETDGQRAHLVGDGTALVLHTDSPMRFWSTLNRAALPSGVGRVNGPRALGRAATALAEAGITVDVTGPDGMIVRLGDGAGSALGRLATGSSDVGFGSVRVVASTLSAQRSLGRYGAAAAVATIVAVVMVAVRRRR
jgi:hypothetical protein